LSSKTELSRRIVSGFFKPNLINDISTTIAGIRFSNPVGLAAGFDKNAELLDSLPLLGFGFAEIGTVTPRPQAGNPRPRLFRMSQDEAIINRMGFNNHGMKVVAERLARRKESHLIVGGNIGKNKDTQNEEAWKDYLACFQALFAHVDYFTINLSSPNTPGLRQLLEKESLTGVLEPVQNENKRQYQAKPIFLKISPDMHEDQIGEIVTVCRQLQIAGIVATNTTLDRSNLISPNCVIQDIGAGGLSGHPLKVRAENSLKILKDEVGSDLILMASGGIMNSNDAVSRIQLGASAVQVYTGLVYSGPDLVREICEALSSA
jgi:dihydroorotate dehydrogenase